MEVVQEVGIGWSSTGGQWGGQGMVFPKGLGVGGCEGLPGAVGNQEDCH